jgi:1-acyl-sn-glycerol-3-phosphate acyltransferase
MSFIRFLLTFVIKFAFWCLCRIADSDELSKMPKTGPLIMVSNHINFLDIPFVYTALYPRKLVGMAKSETWKNPLIGLMLDIWGAMPIERDTSDILGLKTASEVLKAGKILVITPEGTRSRDGRLRRGHQGVVSIAVHNKATIVPVGHYGLERFWRNFKGLRRTRLGFRIGRPFVIDVKGVTVTHGLRAEITTEIMREIAKLLPERNRGNYADPRPEGLENRYLRYVD